MNSPIDRRTAIGSIFAASAFAITPRLLAAETTPATGIGAVAQYVHPKVSWSYAELNKFLEVLPDSGLISMEKSLQLIPQDAAKTVIADRAASSKQIQNQMLWYSSNIVTYPFRHEENIDYHSLTKWVGSELGVDPWILDTQPTIVVERAIQEKLFAGIWDKMSEPQRLEVLAKIDPDNSISDHAAIVALSGAGALAALSMTVSFSGFAFYATMSTVICSVAGFFGVTLPFAAYTGASSIAAFLSGPIGWAFIAIAAAAGVTMAGRANPRKTAAAICQIHALKVAALQEAGQTSDNVFEPKGDPLKRQLVGRWRVSGTRATMEVSLESDGEFTAECYAGPSYKTDDKELFWQGKGIWSIRDRSLSLKRTHIWSHIYWSENPLELYRNRSVIEITPIRAVLAEDACLERL